MKRTLKRELKVPEIAEREAIGSSARGPSIDAASAAPLRWPLVSGSVGPAGHRWGGGGRARACPTVLPAPLTRAVGPTEGKCSARP